LRHQPQLGITVQGFLYSKAAGKVAHFAYGSICAQGSTIAPSANSPFDTNQVCFNIDALPPVVNRGDAMTLVSRTSSLTLMRHNFPSRWQKKLPPSWCGNCPPNEPGFPRVGDPSLRRIDTSRLLRHLSDSSALAS